MRKNIKTKTLHLSSPQASGVKVTDEVIAIFNDMKVRKAQANEDEKRKRKKAVLFCLSKDLKNIVLDDGKEILLGDLGTTVTDPYQEFVKMLPPDDCRYALYDATYETKETKKEDLVFIFWWGPIHNVMQEGCDSRGNVFINVFVFSSYLPTAGLQTAPHSRAR